MPSISYPQSGVNKLADKINHIKLLKSSDRKVKKFFQEIHSLNYFESIVCKPIPSFIISKRGINYTEGVSLSNYLEPDENNPAEYVIIFREDSYDGVVDIINKRFSSKIYADSVRSDVGVRNYNGYDWLFNFFEAWKILEKRNYDFVFSVRYVINCWWFIEAGNLYIIDLEKSEVHNADKFIRDRCPKEVIRNLSKGNQTQFCN